MEIAAIDFETANQYPESACAVGIVRMENGEVTDKKYWLIRPPSLFFSRFNSELHGIYPKDVVNEPCFYELWPEISTMLEGRTVLAHNASFDMGVLRAVIKRYDLLPVDFRYGCTVRISRKHFKNVPNHKLSTLGNFLGLRFNHHNALDDALTCAQVFHAVCQDLQISDTDEVESKLAMKNVFKAFAP
jgi:DNA polymerase III subunit epsilon